MISTVPLPSSPALQPPARIALIGVGAFGRFCLDAYATVPDVEIAAVADADRGALQQLKVPGARLTRDWREVTDDGTIEAVHVATPPRARQGVVASLLAAGISVFCEKPLALTLKDADALIALAQKHGAVLGIDYVMRHQPAYQLLHALTSSGTIGKVRAMSFQNFAQRLPASHWFWDRAQSGGILVEHGVHFFDAFGQLVAKPRRVVGWSARVEAVDVTVEYEAGAAGRFYHEFAYPREVEGARGAVAFEGGILWIDGWIPTRLSGSLLADPRELRALASTWGMLLKARHDTATHVEATFPDRTAQYQAAIVAGMRDVVRAHRQPSHRMVVGAEDARESLALALAAQHAVDSRKGVALGEVLSQGRDYSVAPQ